MLDTETKEFIRQEIKEKFEQRNYDLLVRLVKVEEELKHQREDLKHQRDLIKQQTQLISIGFVILGVLITVFKFVN